jgi:hypothetical protein
VSSPTNPPVAYVYVGENTSPIEIAAFAVQSDASLTPVSGSPFPGPSGNTWGVPPIIPPGGIVTNGNYVFATDGTNIATYARQNNGGLSNVSSINAAFYLDSVDGAFPDYIVGGLELDPSGSSLYASQVTSIDNTFSNFVVQSNGALVYQSSTDAGVAAIRSLLSSPVSQIYYGAGCARMGWVFEAFQPGTDGQLNQVSGFAAAYPPAANTSVFICPVALAVSAQGYLAIAYMETSLDTYAILSADIAIYQMTPSGNLKLETKSAFVTDFTAPNENPINQLRFDPTGVYLAVAGQNGVETFDLASDGTLTKLGSAVEPNVSFVDAQWDNNGNLYAISNAALYVFTSNSGELSLMGTPYSIPATGLAVLPVDANQN